MDVKGKLVCPPNPVLTVTQQDVELQILSVFIISAAPMELPFQLDDASRREPTEKEEKAPEEPAAGAEGKKEKKDVTVSLDNKLNCRFVHLNNGFVVYMVAFNLFFTLLMWYSQQVANKILCFAVHTRRLQWSAAKMQVMSQVRF